jgi:N-acetylmuramic acid 6-phosphate etherase
MALSDALEIAGTFGIAPDRTPMLFAGGSDALLHMAGGTEYDEDLASRDFTKAKVAKGDVVICVSASGRTPYTLAIACMGSKQGAVIIGISNVPDSDLLNISDIAVLLDTGPEMVAGSTRMGAGTAQKIALNMISTLAGVHLGHVYDGMMVNVVADNSKLRDRAARIVAQLAETNTGQARTALDAAGGAVKAAVLIAAGARNTATADAMLAESGGHIGPALDALQAER